MRVESFCLENDYKKEEYTLKISSKADKLALKAQSLCIKHNEAVQALFVELERCNPDKDLQVIETDEFSWFTGQNFT